VNALPGIRQPDVQQGDVGSIPRPDIPRFT